MRAVILAAGRGSRMGTISEGRPKCLVELAGKPLIERQVGALRGAGVSAIAIVRGYLGGMINISGVTYFDNQRWAETNMVISLTAAAVWLRSEPVIVSYADIFYQQTIIRDLMSSRGDLVVAYDRMWRTLWTRRFADPLSDAETFRTDASGNLVEIGQRTSEICEIEGQYMGLLKFTPSAWRAVETVLAALNPKIRDSLDMTRLLRILLNRGFRIGTLGAEGRWGEIDSQADLALYEQMAIEGHLLDE
jgi:L-glutamine-phosphate cytidylyltransferase